MPNVHCPLPNPCSSIVLQVVLLCLPLPSFTFLCSIALANVKFNGIRKKFDHPTYDKSVAVEDPANDEWLDGTLTSVPPRPDKHASIKTPINFNSKRVIAMLAASESSAADEDDMEEQAAAPIVSAGNDNDYDIDFD